MPELTFHPAETQKETRRNIKDAVAGFPRRRSRGRSCKSSRKRATGWKVGAGANRKSFRPSGCRSGLPDRKLVPVPYQTLVRIFEKDGFTSPDRKDHKIFTKAGVPAPRDSHLPRRPVFIIRNLPGLRYEPRKIFRAYGGMIPPT